MSTFAVLLVEGLAARVFSPSARRAATLLLLLDVASFPMPIDTTSWPEAFDSGRIRDVVWGEKDVPAFALLT
jgi:hypothetical protein